MAHDRRKRLRYAQNFLIRPTLVQRIIDRSSIAPDDLVIEIGPGRGALTRGLAASSRQVIAIEKDPTLARRLGREMATLGNVAIFEGDFLDLPLPVTPYKVVANIPFNLTAAIVTRLTGAVNAPEEASLVLQREAAERFLGTPKQTLVSLLIQPWFDLSLSYRFRQHDFVPPPRIDVVLLRFSKRGPPLIPSEETQHYRDFVTYGFTAWKPSMRSAYRSVLSERELGQLARDCGLDLNRKPSEVPFHEWLTLFRAFTQVATEEQRRAIAGAEERRHKQQARIQRKPRQGD